jgi:subtilisin family serine protease
VRELALPVGANAAAAAGELEARPEVRYAEPVLRYRIQGVPDDPLFGQQWALRNIGQQVEDQTGTAGDDVGAVSAWDLQTGSPNVLLAVVDTGVALNHPDLAPNAWRNPGESGGGRESNGVDDDHNGMVDDVAGYDFVDRDATPTDPSGHGTHVAGIALARGGDGFGTAGVSWRGGILPVRVINPAGYGTTLDIAAGIAYAVRMGAKVVNLSLGGGYSHVIDDVIHTNAGTLFVTAAGNAGRDEASLPVYPCALPYDNVVCVAATDPNDALAPFSSYGASAVDLAAPGVDVVSSQPHLVTPLFDDFERGMSRWYNWNGGTWGITDEHASSGTHGLADSPHANYATMARGEAHVPVDLTGLSGCRFDLRLWADLAPFPDGFSVAAQNEDNRFFDQYYTLTDAAHVSGLHVHGDLTAHSGHPMTFILQIFSDQEQQAPGAVVDDVRIRCIDGPGPPGESFEVFSGTSMAAPMVSGAAVLLWSRNGSLSVAAIRKALLDGVDKRPGLAGKVASGGRLDLRRSLESVPAGTPPPPPPPPPEQPPPSSPPPATTAQTVAASTAASGGQAMEPDAESIGEVTASLPAARRSRGLRERHLVVRLAGSRSVRGLSLGRLAIVAPRHAAVVASCAGRGCPWGRRVVAFESRGDGLGPDAVRAVGAVRGRTLRPGTALAFLITARGERARLTLRIAPGGRWTLERACAAPGARLGACA